MLADLTVQALEKIWTIEETFIWMEMSYRPFPAQLQATRSQNQPVCGSNMRELCDEDQQVHPI